MAYIEATPIFTPVGPPVPQTTTQSPAPQPNIIIRNDINNVNKTNVTVNKDAPFCCCDCWWMKAAWRRTKHDSTCAFIRRTTA